MWGWMLEYWPLVAWAVGGGVTVALWLYGTGKLSGVSQAAALQLERRMDEGGRRLSDLTSKLMVLPGTMSNLQEEQTRQRIELGKMEEHIANLRVGMARLEERHRIENGRT